MDVIQTQHFTHALLLQLRPSSHSGLPEDAASCTEAILLLQPRKIIAQLRHLSYKTSNYSNMRGYEH